MRKLIYGISALALLALNFAPSVADDAAKAVVAKEDAAPAEKAEKKCPISGKAAKDEFFVNINGENTNFCCGNCRKAFITKLKVVEDKEKKCALSGRPADETKVLFHKSAATHKFCCGDCRAKFVKEKGIELKEGTGKCPFSGKPGLEETTIVVDGEKVSFCCANCQKKWIKTNLPGLADANEGNCPFSKKPGGAETALVVVTFAEKNFCCGNCQAKYVAKNFPKEEEKKEEKKEGEKAEPAAEPKKEVRTS
jgi:hypothetical protein